MKNNRLGFEWGSPARGAAAEARSAAWGGVSALSRITGMARSTIGRGLVELRSAATDVAAGGFVAQDETIGEVGAAGSVWVVEGGDRRSEDY